jgi:hypothetical protein
MSIAEKLVTVAENIPKVYNAGYEKGKSENSDSYYDTFWDNFQLNGERLNYNSACASPTSGMYIWTDVNFIPKFDMTPTQCAGMFRYSGIVNLKRCLEKAGRVLDTSQSTNVSEMFSGANLLEEVPAFDIGMTTAVNQLFAYCRKLKNIYLKNVRPIYSFYTSFTQCNSLEDVVIEGEIGMNFNIQYSPLLTVESAKSIITHLVNYSGTENEFAYSVTFHSDVWVRLDAEGNTAPDGNTWKEYVDNIGWNR